MEAFGSSSDQDDILRPVLRSLPCHRQLGTTAPLHSIAAITISSSSADDSVLLPMMLHSSHASDSVSDSDESMPQCHISLDPTTIAISISDSVSENERCSSLPFQNDTNNSTFRCNRIAAPLFFTSNTYFVFLFCFPLCPVRLFFSP